MTDARELFIGVVRPVGVGGKALNAAIERALKAYAYQTRDLHLSDYLDPPYEGPHRDDRIEHLIERGNHLCRNEKNAEAVIHRAIDDLIGRRKARIDAGDSPTFGRTAFVFDSLKRPAEVNLLRKTYGPWFILIGAQSRLDKRIGVLRDQIRETHSLWSDERVDARAHQLIDLDRHQDDPWGQDVLNTFPRADLFLEISGPRSSQEQLDRFFALLFGLNVVPTDEEHGMAAAFLASLRSSSPDRRVGAALTEGSDQASVVAVGMNEVAKPKGGHPGDPTEGDPTVVAMSFNRTRIRKLLATTLEGLSQQEAYLTEGMMDRVKDESKLELLLDELLEGPLKEAPVRHLIEFHKAVHAEVSAILDAARRRVGTRGLKLYCTTYPCHLCAKEIVAAGIEEVIYIEPYPKSLTQAMYEDQISEAADDPDETKIPFRPFVGIAPSRFNDLFASSEWSIVSDGVEDPVSLLPKLGGQLPQNTSLMSREKQASQRRTEKTSAESKEKEMEK